jgi:glycosyltransferase involved in cell wall biosynthesis
MVLRPSEGGAFRHVASLGSELRRMGHEVAICGPHARHAEALDVEVIPLEIVRPLSPREDARSVEALVAVMRRFRPDLIHSHGSKGGVMARVAALSCTGTPLVSTPHGYAFAGALPRPPERALFWLAERLTTPLADRVICVCEEEARLARQFCSEDRIRVIHNGIEPLERPDPDEEALAFRGEDGILLGAISGLRPGKGLETLLSAFSILRRDHPRMRLLIVGGGPEEERLRTQVSRGDLEDVVRIAGPVENPFPMMVAADVLVAPSWSESFPYSILEAMSLGMPLVATRVGGIPEAIEDGVTGVLVPPQRAAPLAEAIVALASDPARAASLGEAAARRLRALFTLSRMVEQTVAVYEELTDRAGMQPAVHG